VDVFGDELSIVIDETIGYCLGDINKRILYGYVERKVFLNTKSLTN
jgi:hypothetical protein